MIMAAALAMAGGVTPVARLAAQEPAATGEAHVHTAKAFQIPESMQAEHREIEQALGLATKQPGKVGSAARELAAVLHPHFVREEQIALPPLGLLAPLSRGEYTPDMRDVLPLTDSLRAELPRMLEEHVAIHAATVRLLATARAAGDAATVRLAEQLAVHAQGEEQMFYPAALIVGDMVRARAVH